MVKGPPQQPKHAQRGVCYNCAKPGHFIADCPEKPGQFKGTKKKMSNGKKNQKSQKQDKFPINKLAEAIVKAQAKSTGKTADVSALSLVDFQ